VNGAPATRRDYHSTAEREEVERQAKEIARAKLCEMMIAEQFHARVYIAYADGATDE
jgi:hypothetical protein